MPKKIWGNWGMDISAYCIKDAVFFALYSGHRPVAGFSVATCFPVWYCMCDHMLYVLSVNKQCSIGYQAHTISIPHLFYCIFKYTRNIASKPKMAWKYLTNYLQIPNVWFLSTSQTRCWIVRVGYCYIRHSKNVVYMQWYIPIFPSWYSGACLDGISILRMAWWDTTNSLTKRHAAVVYHIKRNGFGSSERIENAEPRH